ncbi:MAG: energy transducer TonB, partial [Candidatus Omnitrophica bacterium]|nr:energy transducer TonB [Candidatus Omnitrophota bacterium]
MEKRKLCLAMIFLMAFSFLSLHASDTREIKLKFFEGTREGKSEPPKFVSSSYLQPTVTASINPSVTVSLESRFGLNEEQMQIKKVFNLKDVNLITEADLQWNTRSSDRIFHIFRLDSKEYLVLISPPDRNRKRQLRIEVFEQSEMGKNSLLDTEIILPEKNIAVFGFEDNKGKPYFLSIHLPPPLPPPPPEAKKKEIEDFEKGAVKIMGEIKPPKPIKIVKPSYPEIARKAKVEGVVILNVRTDEYGRVVRAKILRGKDPLLNDAAIDAVKQWIYEPFILNGKPRQVVFTATVQFKLKQEKDKDAAKGEVDVKSTLEPPKPIKKVLPVYPEVARKAGVEGVVILEVKTDEKGCVEKVVVLKSQSSMLNQAAVAAVKQWKFEPYYSKGKPVPIVFTITVQF